MADKLLEGILGKTPKGLMENPNLINDIEMIDSARQGDFSGAIAKDKRNLVGRQVVYTAWSLDLLDGTKFWQSYSKLKTALNEAGDRNELNLEGSGSVLALRYLTKLAYGKEIDIPFRFKKSFKWAESKFTKKKAIKTLENALMNPNIFDHEISYIKGLMNSGDYGNNTRLEKAIGHMKEALDFFPESGSKEDKHAILTSITELYMNQYFNGDKDLSKSRTGREYRVDKLNKSIEYGLEASKEMPESRETHKLLEVLYEEKERLYHIKVVNKKRADILREKLEIEAKKYEATLKAKEATSPTVSSLERATEEGYSLHEEAIPLDKAKGTKERERRAKETSN